MPIGAHHTEGERTKVLERYLQCLQKLSQNISLLESLQSSATVGLCKVFFTFVKG